jgi:methionyl-tRNA formyltransferase
MDTEIDTGPIVYSSSFGISDRDTGLSVSATAARQGLPLLARLLEDASGDPAWIPATPQDLSHRRYYGREVPEDGRIRWSHSARQLVDFIRASDYLPFVSPWGHPVARLRGEEIEILKASRTYEPCNAKPGTVGHYENEGTVCVATADEWIRVHRVRVDDEMTDADAVLAADDLLADG